MGRCGVIFIGSQAVDDPAKISASRWADKPVRTANTLKLGRKMVALRGSAVFAEPVSKAPISADARRLVVKESEPNRGRHESCSPGDVR